MARKRMATTVVIAAVSLAAWQCGTAPTDQTPGGPGGPTGPGPSTPSPTLPPPLPPETFVGAGDIAMCGGPNHPPGRHEDTARLLDTIGGTVFTLGDNAYPNGSRDDYRNCYHRSWGRHADRTRPTPGNHEYNLLSAAMPYFDYFGELAGPRGLGYYSFYLGAWHVISLNSNDEESGSGVSVLPGSPQGQWLQQELASNRPKCTLAYWHHPLFTSGQNGQNPRMRGFFQMLYDANADLVLSAHDHLYERFAPQAPDGRLDPARGIRQFVVGTGGTVPLYRFLTTRPNSEIQNNVDHGVLRLTLHADSYQWEFVTPGGTKDSGGPVACH